MSHDEDPGSRRRHEFYRIRGTKNNSEELHSAWLSKVHEKHVLFLKDKLIWMAEWPRDMEKQRENPHSLVHLSNGRASSLLSQEFQKGIGSEVEQTGLHPVLLWNSSVTGTTATPQHQPMNTFIVEKLLHDLNKFCTNINWSFIFFSHKLFIFFFKQREVNGNEKGKLKYNPIGVENCDIPGWTTEKTKLADWVNNVNFSLARKILNITGAVSTLLGPFEYPHYAKNRKLLLCQLNCVPFFIHTRVLLSSQKAMQHIQR